MKMVKCPKCELNYMNEDAESCEVCRKMLHGTDTENEVEICPECGEPFDTGKPMCNACLKLMKSQAEDEDDIEDENADIDIEDEETELEDDIEDLDELGISIIDDVEDL